MKKILTILFSFILVFNVLNTVVMAAMFKDVSNDAYYKDSVEALSLYGIVSGYEGYFNPEAYITRAEFSKIAAITGGYEKEVSGKAGSTRFSDVDISHWANGYINTVAVNSIIVGYPDGKFLPQNNITYQEAVTVILRLMDYTTSDLGDNWPYAYLAKARSLGLLDGIEKSGAELITRGDVCLLINRALSLDLNGKQEELISKLDIKTTDELLVIATRNEDKSIDLGSVKTSGGTYKIANENVPVVPLTKVKFVLNSDDEIINSITLYTPEIVTTTVETVAGETVYFGNNTNSKSLSIKESTPCYNDGTISSFGNMKNIIEEGAKVSFAYEKDGSLGYVIVNKLEYSEPKVVYKSAEETLSSLGADENTIIIRDGLKADVDDIQIYDVCYFQSGNNTAYVYSDKITGIYEEAYPSKASVSSVLISGVTLEIETQTAAYKLGEKSGSYSFKSRVTALLGRDGKIVDIVDLSDSSASDYGVLLSVENSIDDGSQVTLLNLLTGAGEKISLKTTKDYSEKIGYVGRISYDEVGFAQFNVVSDNTLYGTVDKENMKIGSKWLSAGCKIIEILYVPEHHTGTAKAQKIEFADLGENLSKNQCVYAVVGGEFGDITAIFVTDITDDAYEYGILRSSKMSETANDISGSYEVFTASGNTENFKMDAYLKISSGIGVEMVRDGSTLKSIKALNSLTTGAKCQAFDYSRIKFNDKIYSVSSNALITVKTSAGYRVLSVEDAQDYIGKNVRVYTDSNIKNNAEAKVVIFEN